MSCDLGERLNKKSIEVSGINRTILAIRRNNNNSIDKTFNGEESVLFNQLKEKYGEMEAIKKKNFIYSDSFINSISHIEVQKEISTSTISSVLNKHKVSIGDVNTQGEPSVDVVINGVGRYKSVLDHLSQKMGVPYSVISFEDALSIHNVDKNTKSFVYKNEVFLIKGKFNQEDIIHEYSHFITEHIKQNQTDMYLSLLDKVKEKYPKIYSLARSKYKGIQYNTPFGKADYTESDIDDEAVTMAIAYEADGIIKSGGIKGMVSSVWNYLLSTFGIRKSDSIYNVADKMVNGKFRKLDNIVFGYTRYSVSQSFPAAFSHISDLIESWVNIKPLSKEQRQLMSQVEYISRNYVIDDVNGVPHYNGKALTQSQAYKNSAGRKWNWNKTYVNQWVKDDNPLPDISTTQRQLKKDFGIYIAEYSVNQLSEQIGRLSNSATNTPEIQNKINALTEIRTKMRLNLENRNAQRAATSIGTTIDIDYTKRTSYHYVIMDRIGRYMQQYGIAGKDYTIVDDKTMNIDSLGISSELNDESDYIYIKTNDGLLHILDITDGKMASSKNNFIGDAFMGKNDSVENAVNDEVNQRAMRMGVTIASLQHHNKITDKIGNTDVLELNVYDLNDADLSVKPVHKNAIMSKAREVLGKFIKASNHTQFDEIHKNEAAWELKTEMSHIDKMALNLKEKYSIDIIQQLQSKDLDKAEEILSKALYKSKDNVSSYNEAKSQYILQAIKTIHEIRTNPIMEENEGDIGILYLFKSLSNIDNKYFKWFYDLVSKALNKAKNKMLEFTNRHENIIKKLIAENSSLFSKARFTSESDRFFKNLWTNDELYKGHIYVDPKTSIGEWASTQENQNGWNLLTQTEKDYSTFVVKQVKEIIIKQKITAGYSEADALIYYETTYGADGMMPILRKNINDAWNKMANSAMNMDLKGTLSHLKDYTTQAVNNNFEMTQYTKEDNTDKVPNILILFKEQREKIIEVAEAEGKGYEKNIFILLNKVSGNVYTQEAMNPVSESYHAISRIVEELPNEYGAEQVNLKKALHQVYNRFIKLKSSDSESMGHKPYRQLKGLRSVLTGAGVDNQSIDKALDLVRSTHSKITLALRPFSDLYNGLQQQLKFFGRALSGTINSLIGKDSVFTLSTWISVLPLVFKQIGDKGAQKKIMLLMKEMNMYNSDMFDLVKPKFTDPTDTRYYLMRSSVLTGLNYAGDYLAREMLMIALMIKEGSWNAYSVVTDADGDRLVYNAEEDLRPDSDKQGALNQNNIDGVVGSGHDYKQKRRMKELGNMFYGTYDQECLRLIEQAGWGRLIMQFRRYVPDFIAEAWVKGHSSQAHGSYKEHLNDKGEIEHIWKDGYHEGFLRSVLWGAFNPMKLASISNRIRNKEEISQQDKVVMENVSKFSADIIMILSLVALSMLVGGDDDEDEAILGYNKWINRRADNLYRDFMLPINVYEMAKIASTPAVATGTITNLANLVWELGISAKNMELTLSAKKGLIRFTPIVNSIESTSQVFGRSIVNLVESNSDRAKRENREVKRKYRLTEAYKIKKRIKEEKKRILDMQNDND